MKPAPNIPTKTRPFEYDRMEPHEFRAALEQLDLDPLEFARLTGKNRRRVERLLTGEEDIGHDVLILCSLLTLPGALELAERVTDSVVHEYEETD